MIRLIRNTIKRSQRGFTLVEMAVVIAILGVLAAVATPLLVNYLGGAKERAYDADLGVIQTAVDAAFSAPNNARFLGKNQYAILGRAVGLPTDTANPTNRTGHTVRCKVSTSDAGCVVGSSDHPDDGTPLLASERDATVGVDNPDWNPLGGIQGADLLKAAAVAPTTGQIIAWTDDLGGTADAVREIQAAVVTAAVGTTPASVATSPDKWTTMEVTRDGTVYYVDPRYYFVDMAGLVSSGFLKEVPKSSSKDNSRLAHTNALNTATGSYTYYVDDKGKVRTLLFSFPRTGDPTVNTGFVTGVYP